MVCARLNGVLEVLELVRTGPSPVSQFRRSFVHVQFQYGEEQCELRRLSTTLAHQRPICGLTCSESAAVTASEDATLRVLDLRGLHVASTLHGHQAPLLSTCLHRELGVSPEGRGKGSAAFNAVVVQ